MNEPEHKQACKPDYFLILYISEREIWFLSDSSGSLKQFFPLYQLQERSKQKTRPGTQETKTTPDTDTRQPRDEAGAPKRLENCGHEMSFVSHFDCWIWPENDSPSSMVGPNLILWEHIIKICIACIVPLARTPTRYRVIFRGWGNNPTRCFEDKD